MTHNSRCMGAVKFSLLWYARLAYSIVSAPAQGLAVSFLSQLAGNLTVRYTVGQSQLLDASTGEGSWLKSAAPSTTYIQGSSWIWSIIRLW